jgi:hypothetical protein
LQGHRYSPYSIPIWNALERAGGVAAKMPVIDFVKIGCYR